MEEAWRKVMAPALKALGSACGALVAGLAERVFESAPNDNELEMNRRDCRERERERYRGEIVLCQFRRM